MRLGQVRCPILAPVFLHLFNFNMNRPHKMECFDWGANYLYRRHPDEKEAREKVRDMCYRKMKAVYDTWFALGTHSNYPFSK